MTKRVIYKKSPLAEVIFQAQFPVILRINNEEPSSFQGQIKKKYPFYNLVKEQQNQIDVDFQEKIASLKTINNLNNHTFVSESKKFKVNMTSSFFALSTVAYTKWEDFLGYLKEVFTLFEAEYSPSFYTRIGLRYINLFSRSQWGLKSCRWNDLFKPHVLGVVTPEVEDGTSTYISETEYKKPESEYVQKRHFEFVNDNRYNEKSLLIDCDYFTTSVTRISEIWKKAEDLHELSTGYIANSIKDVLKSAMEPEPIQ